MASPVTGPIPPESNPPIQPYFYAPSQFNISAITLGQTTTITTSVNNNFVVGQNVRTIIPWNYGTRQLNEQSALVISLPAANQVEINIDSSRYDSFISNPAGPKTQAQILPIGDFNSGNINSSGNLVLATGIPGSFENISPL